ncbi:unnamed protein product [Cylicocyclus nassatus]|uniref:Uncharacterized protein n=1 Tax=Cylicocyclus nassatus TaxID=53992 RepID=A0AA36DQP0_CYLNA|nr:unnamed protein product [Cylicocyclus nassatus]
MYRLYFILCILYKDAASYNCLEKNLKNSVRENLKKELEKVNAEYVCEIEYELADDIALYAMGHPRYEKEMKKLVKFVKSFERFFFKVKRFE